MSNIDKQQIRADIAKRKAMPDFGISSDTNIERLKVIQETQPSFNQDVVEALLDELEAKDKKIAEQRETLLAARSHVMQCARMGDAHANGVLQAIDRAAAGKGEAS
jgi:hypothetical protein